MDEKPHKSDTAKREEEILVFWKENNIFKKSLEKPAPKGEFVFYDGPPFATGIPHYGHLLPGTIKDVIPRYKTMQGYHVARRWGWDCHGLPVENLIEKELGLETKKDIEAYGIEKFNDAARNSVLRYADVWREVIPRSGRWVDMDNDYRTMDASYTESVWWAFKNLYDKGLVYEGFKSMHICPRCETTLSNFEVNQGYKDITDISVYVKCKLVDESDTYLLVWTTTPWTLPGNVALAVGEDITYCKFKPPGSQETYIVAKDRINAVFKDVEFDENTKLLGSLSILKGKDLIGKSYKPLFDYYAKDEALKNREHGWKVYGADFVTTEDGTGIVHIAPAFGTDDMELGKTHNLPFVQHVSMDGHMKPEVTDFAGMMVKPKSDDEKERLGTDIAVIRYLQEQGSFFDKEKITHSYPHCWRCDTPLLNYATSSWFIEVSKVREKLSALNKAVSWVPESIGENRFGNWLSEAKDWSISRGRFWGAPLPVWKCASCDRVEILGSIADLKKHAQPHNSYTVMRHGEAEHNIAGIVSSNKDAPMHLTEAGKKMASATAQKLHKEGIDVIISSPFVRCRETASIVAEEIGLSADSIIYDERIGELHMGVFDGKTLDEYRGFFRDTKDRFERAPEGGETLTELMRRTGEFLYNIDATYQNKNILIISHEATINSLHTISHATHIRDAVARKEDATLSPGVGECNALDFWPAPHDTNYMIDVHRPYIDEVDVRCTCGEKMTRIPEVFDTWFDSGSMPYAQNNYPFTHKDAFEKKGALFPADFIAEGLDQTRGWFYTLLVLNGLLFDTAPYKHVVVNGLVLAEDGKKMSKRLKNYPDLSIVFDTYGADAFRYYLMSSPAVRAEDVALSEKGIDEVAKKNIGRLVNVLSFYEMYQGEEGGMGDATKSNHVLDRWILARLFETRDEMTRSLDAYEIDRAVRPIALFIDDLSTWYLRRSRDRFKSGDEIDEVQVRTTLRYVLREFAKLIAPVMPFIAEYVYQKVKIDTDEESVHLAEWSEEGHVDTQALDNMKYVRELVSLGLEARAREGIKIRQPLETLFVEGKRFDEEYTILIREELNVKRVIYEYSELKLDTTITPELKKEGRMRDIIRLIQDERKKNDFVPSDMVYASFDVDGELKDIIEEFGEHIKKETGLKEITFKELSVEKRKIDDLEIGIELEK